MNNELERQLAEAVHNGLGGNGWAYTNCGGEELRTHYDLLVAAAKAVIELMQKRTQEISIVKPFESALKADESDKVVHLNINTTLPIDPQRVLSGASGKLQDVVVVGRETDGGFYFASSMPDAAEVLWLLKLGEKMLFDVTGKG